MFDMILNKSWPGRGPYGSFYIQKVKIYQNHFFRTYRLEPNLWNYCKKQAYVKKFLSLLLTSTPPQTTSLTVNKGKGRLHEKLFDLLTHFLSYLDSWTSCMQIEWRLGWTRKFLPQVRNSWLSNQGLLCYIADYWIFIDKSLIKMSA